MERRQTSIDGAHRFVSRRAWALAAALLGLSVSLASCTKQNKESSQAPARRELLRNLSERVYLPTFTEFAADAKALETAAQAYAASLAAEDLEATRTAWKKAMATWQRAELMQVGPTAIASDGTPGGKGLRNEIYSFPDRFPCGMDRVIVTQQYKDVATLRTATDYNVRGLGTLEALLFDARLETACKADDSTATPEAWAALSTDELRKRRAAYASTLATDLRTNADAVVAAWKDGFQEALVTAGDGSKLFATTGEAINAVSDGLFYLDTETKDMKLGDPGGFTLTCMETPCPERVEHPFARVSKVSIVANIDGFKHVFHGRPPMPGASGMWGVRDLLISVSAKALADDMDRLLEDAQLQAAMIPVSLEDALAEDKHPQVGRAYAALQALTARLKSDYLSTLDLRAPMHAAGDND